MLQSSRLPGAMLFSGEDGVGKKLFALEIARALNCRSPQGVEACGTCPACKRTLNINFPASDESDDWKGIIWTDHPDVGLVVATNHPFALPGHTFLATRCRRDRKSSDAKQNCERCRSAGARACGARQFEPRA